MSRITVQPEDHCGDKLKMLLEAALDFPKEVQVQVREVNLNWTCIDGKLLPLVHIMFKE